MGARTSVTRFDLIALGIMAVSGLIGFARGALRELATVIAFFAAVVIALTTLRYSGPQMRHWVHPGWVANVAALLAVFMLSYIAVRLIGTSLARSLHDVHALHGLDRVAGLGIGLVRGFVILGAFQLVINAATPRDRMPRWISHAALYPAADDSAQALKALEPAGLAIVGKLAPALKQAVGQDDDDKGSDRRSAPRKTPRAALEGQP
jgi:membrane protein required for colicin V production